MAKAARILAGLKRDGRIETRRDRSHRVLVKGNPEGYDPAAEAVTPDVKVAPAA
jgi:hypothetical protein